MRKYYWALILLVKKFQSSVFSLQAPGRSVNIDRTRMWHQARHPEVNINLSTIADILNESPNQALRYKFRHLSHSNEKTIIQEGYLEKYP